MPCLLRNSFAKYHLVSLFSFYNCHILFVLKYFVETIQNQGIRFRLYTCERFKREKLLAEASVMFAMVNLDEDMCKIIPLERAFVSTT